MPTKRKQTTAKVARIAARLDDPAHIARIADLKAALHSIGDTPASRLAWVVRFLAEDPTTWHPAVRAAHGDCLQMVALRGAMDLADLAAALAPDEITSLHRELGGGLRKLLNEWPAGQLPMMEIPNEGKSESLVRASGVGKKPAIFGTTQGHVTVRTALFHAVKDLILQAGERLLACSACGAPFIAARKQEYCTPRCSQRVRNQNRVDKRERKTSRRKGAK